MKITASLRVLLVMLCMVMVFSLFACGEEYPTMTDTPDAGTETEAQTEENVQGTVPAPETDSEEATTTEEAEETTVEKETTSETESTTTEETTTEETTAEEDTSEEETTAPACEHEEEVVAGKAATCTEAGLTDGKKCSKCGDTILAQEVIPAKGHDLSDVKAVDATCVATGNVAHKHCSVCEKNFDTEGQEIADVTIAINTDNHVWDAGTTAEDVKCGDTADVTFKCTNDGCDATDVQTGATVEHAWNEIGRVNATCTTAGSISYECTRGDCEETKTDPIDVDPTAHNLKAVAAVAATCTAKGNVAHDHCELCGKNFDEFGGEIAVVETDINADNHTGTTTPNANCEQICDACGQKATDELVHDLKDVTAVEADCDTAGSVAHKHCDRCGKNYDADGAEIADIVVGAKGHTEEKVDAVAPTCTKTGLTEGTKCSVCGDTIVAQNTVDATGHSKVAVAYLASTTKETGFKAHTGCANCDAAWDKETDAEITDGSHVIPVLDPTTNYYFGYEELKGLNTTISTSEPAADRTYVRWIRNKKGGDGYFELPMDATNDAGKYLIIKYRTNSETYIQAWAKTTSDSLGTANAGDSFSLYTKNDGEWHLAIYDLDAKLKAVDKTEDGKYLINTLRFDIFDDERSEGYFDVAYVAVSDDIEKLKTALFDGDNAYCEHKTVSNIQWSEEAGAYVGDCFCDNYSAEMLHTVEPLAENGNCVTATQQDGFVRYTVTSEGNKDVYFHPLKSNTAVTGLYVVVKYRMYNGTATTASARSVFIGNTENGAVGGAETGNYKPDTFIADGEWHYYVITVDPSKNTHVVENDDHTYSLKYMRMGFNPSAFNGTCYMDIDFIAFADQATIAEAFAAKYDAFVGFTTNLDKGNNLVNGEQYYTADARGNSAEIVMDLSGKKLNNALSLEIGGWVCTRGGIATYQYRVVKVDGVKVESPKAITWTTIDSGNDIYTVVGKAIGYSSACGTNSKFRAQPINLLEFAGHTVEVEVVATTTYGKEIVIVRVTNVEVPSECATHSCSDWHYVSNVGTEFEGTRYAVEGGTCDLCGKTVTRAAVIAFNFDSVASADSEGTNNSMAAFGTGGGAMVTDPDARVTTQDAIYLRSNQFLMGSGWLGVNGEIDIENAYYRILDAEGNALTDWQEKTISDFDSKDIRPQVKPETAGSYTSVKNQLSAQGVTDFTAYGFRTNNLNTKIGDVEYASTDTPICIEYAVKIADAPEGADLIRVIVFQNVYKYN